MKMTEDQARKLLAQAFPDVSETVRKRNPEIYGKAIAVEAAPTMPGKRIRQGEPKMNALESEWFEICKRTYPQECQIIAQGLRWRLGNGIWYKPDVVVIGLSVYVYEVKGPHAYRGGFENLKVAAGLYPKVNWILVWKENGQWKEQGVMP